MCKFSNPSELCNHSECHLHNLSRDSQKSTAELIGDLSRLAEQQSIDLFKLIEMNSKLSYDLTKLEQLIKSSPNPRLMNQNSSEPQVNSLNSFALLPSFPSPTTPHDLFIRSDFPLPVPIYKEKGFCMKLSIFDENNIKVPLTGSYLFSLSLFTLDSPPKLLKVNKSGKKILRGSVDAYSDQTGSICFENVVVNEVSSHYPSNKFTLSVACKNSSRFEPLHFPNLLIKSRKHQNRH